MGVVVVLYRFGIPQYMKGKMKTIYLFFLIIGIIFIIGCAPKEIVEEPTQDITQEEEKLTEPEPVVEEIVPEVIEEEAIIETEEEKEEVPEPEEVSPILQLVNGKTLEERIKDAYDNLHEPGSSDKIVNDFPDLVLVYTDDPEPSIKSIFPPEILPFRYYYSEQADRTFNLCGVGRSVFICKGKLDRAINK